MTWNEERGRFALGSVTAIAANQMYLNILLLIVSDDEGENDSMFGL